MVKMPESDIIEDTIAFWSRRTGREISRERTRQMVANVSGFFEVLAEWDRKARDEGGVAETVRAGHAHLETLRPGREQR